ncbi:hypothetical protein GCM10012280_49550 [Wenjunlia tyrosinilytica]|uniref:Uncharacterized protein n=1 Tax=Wenjunlia tyrosinilytica TaxID=1544741 RepID=A0A917ZWU5_9ACTN|nr:hypothetical protein GCM10012280_49550 [Wenjunlia tyrosinilytica]
MPRAAQEVGDPAPPRRRRPQASTWLRRHPHGRVGGRRVEAGPRAGRDAQARPAPLEDLREKPRKTASLLGDFIRTCEKAVALQ